MGIADVGIWAQQNQIDSGKSILVKQIIALGEINKWQATCVVRLQTKYNIKDSGGKIFEVKLDWRKVDLGEGFGTRGI